MDKYNSTSTYNELDDTKEHRSISEEYEFYHAVRDGNLDYVRKNCEQHTFEKPDGMGLLSINPLTNLKYHYCITAALLSRHCIEGGMETELAYRLSDMYISKLDFCHDKEAIVNWHDKMVLDFTGKMYLLKTHNGLSISVSAALDYIYKHITETITLNDIAKATSLSSCYLSRLFAKETGLSIKDYILEKKIEKAQNLLKYSDSTSAEIAQFLSFSSQSHFISTFKRLTGMTPKKYKDNYARKIW